jgi:hypothetical protein
MMSKGFYQQIEKLMPWIPKLSGKLAKRLETFDPRQPVTMIAEMEKEIEKVAKRFTAHPQLLLRGMRLMMKHPYFATALTKTIQDCIRSLEKQMAVDPRATQFLRLIEETDREVPFRSWLVLQEHVDLRLLVRPLCLAGTAVEDARKLKGEAKAAVLIEGLGKTSEVLYYPYLLALWQLTCLSRGKWPKQPRFGGLMEQLPARLSDYPGLVDSDAHWMRNSARHERWEPIPGEDAIIMWDDHTPRTKVTLSELEKKVNDMYQIAGVTFVSAAHYYLFRNLLTDTGSWELFAKMVPAIVEVSDLEGSNDAVIEERFEPELQAIRVKFAPLIDFIQSKAPRVVGQQEPAS